MRQNSRKFVEKSACVSPTDRKDLGLDLRRILTVDDLPRMGDLTALRGVRWPEAMGLLSSLACQVRSSVEWLQADVGQSSQADRWVHFKAWKRSL